MLTLGLTGGIGSGKSAAARRIATRAGVRVLYADDLARRLMHDDAALRDALVARFGPAVYDAEGRLNRAALAARVFADEAERAALNALVHPAVGRAARAARAAAEADGVRLFVYEAALLFETGADRLCDVVAVVDAPAETRVARVVARDGATPEAVRARMAAQLDPAEARRRADVVLDNGGDLAHLHAQVDALYDRLVTTAS